MSKKPNLRTKLTDLEFVEELSDLELETVAGGQAPSSVLDRVKLDLSNLATRLGNSDRDKLQAHFLNIRELESRLM